jgi:uncharacterized protein (TIGR02996 family)
MSLEELFAAITAAPDDDAPRLVYADALLERGDAHGELIQIECRLATMVNQDPALVARRDELRMAHPEWFGVFPSHRGFIEEGFITLGAFDDTQQLLDRKILLRTIKVAGSAADELLRLLAHPALAAVERIEIRAYANELVTMLAQCDPAKLRLLTKVEVHGSVAPEIWRALMASPIGRQLKDPQQRPSKPTPIGPPIISPHPIGNIMMPVQPPVQPRIIPVSTQPTPWQWPRWLTVSVWIFGAGFLVAVTVAALILGLRR